MQHDVKKGVKHFWNRKAFDNKPLTPVLSERVACHAFDNHQLLRLMRQSVLKEPREVAPKLIHHLARESNFIRQSLHGVGESFDRLRTTGLRG